MGIGKIHNLTEITLTRFACLAHNSRSHTSHQQVSSPPPNCTPRAAPSRTSHDAVLRRLRRLVGPEHALQRRHPLLHLPLRLGREQVRMLVLHLDLE